MLQNKEGQRVPNVIFRTRNGGEWVDVSTDDIFAGKNVVVFSLPGAFTPTCSGSHVPRFNELAATLEQQGVDEIVCMSVNDTFVMNAWAADQHAENITFIPDGNGEFSQGMGMLVDKDDLGFGKRSWRYSMLVRDGVIDKMFIEAEVPGDPFEVSDADTMLEYIRPGAPRPEDVAIFTRPGCPFCAKAKAALDAAGVSYQEIILDGELTTRAVRAIAGADSVPQLYADGELIGDSEAIVARYAREAVA